ncbi:histidine kinase [Enterococcus silesiacus]|uniref:Histidine kinase n=1 Tax=Enterococcus silesiacus TaxID=332949 RepID=A0A0S3K9B1_9ENTE|nr:MupG family TIM beta-alpha barrel fold protein [Enterococcus silesiacus]ALS00837.1 histidine kinase [Enterococcus silesiacus]OJG91578.1 hypothetical protein RV15_GL000462 [Enterococcus silesiacus]
MYGISIFLNEDMTNETRNYIQEMSAIGFKGLFTSLHIPEDNTALYSQRLKELGAIALECEMSLMVDISGTALKQAGFSFDDLAELLAIGVTGLRMDYAVSNQKIAEASQQLKIGLNASTISEADIVELKSFNANFANFETWHNYYPRPETGLSSHTFAEKNHWLKQSGFQVFAFVSGNSQLRGPLFAGLPTLEKHRYDNPFAAAIELKENNQIDGVYIGDPEISKRTMHQFKQFNADQMILLEVADIGSSYYTHILGKHYNRQDAARDVIRSAEARFKEVATIQPERALERKKGSVTIDNLLYGRYMGEIQIAKKDLPADKKVTVAAQVVPEDRSLLKLIKAGRAFKLIEKGTI